MPARILDKHLRAIRGHIRTHALPRPDRLVISTGTGQALMEFTADTALDRLTRLVRWAETLADVTAAWVLLPNGRLIVTVAGIGPNELLVSAGIACLLAKLGGRSIDRDGGEFELGCWDPGMVRLVVDRTVTGDLADLHALLAAARTALRAATDHRQAVAS